jgi:hypothetical protein
MTSVSGCVGPGYSDLRPLSGGKGFSPIIDDLVDKLATPGPQPEGDIARALAICAGYSYADGDTVATMMTRLGLPNNHCLQVSEVVDAMFICSTAYVVQSADNRVAIVCYRGTQPTNLVNWLTDLTIEPTRIQIPANGKLVQTSGDMYVHGGFYRNVRATRYRVGEALGQAHSRHSILPPGSGHPAAPFRPRRLEALYLTGHSLGGAMAALMAILIHTDPSYEPFRRLLKGVYTFGQPMIGNQALADACQSVGLGELVHRYVYRHDVVPQVPPKEAGDFAHFGNEQRYFGKWEQSEHTGQMHAAGLLEIPADSAIRQIPGFSKVRLSHSLHDHGPQYYIGALTPSDAETEFGDHDLGTITPL